MKKIVKKFPQTPLTLKIASSRSNFISNIRHVFRRFSYIVWCAEYLKNSKKFPAHTLDLENLYFKVKDTSVIFSIIFFVLSPSNYIRKHSEILASTKNEIWPWNTDFQDQQCFEEFKNYFLRIQNIKFCLKTLNILFLNKENKWRSLV